MSGNKTIVTSQEELDKLPLDHDGRIIIKFGTPDDRAIVRERYKRPVAAWENSSVEAWENSSVVAWGNSSVEAWENSSVVAWGNSSVVAWGNSSVEAYETSFVEALDNSSVEALDNSSVVALDNSSVVACGTSSVVALDNSSVVALDNSSVVACGNAQVTDRTKTHRIRTSGNARIVYDPGTPEEYAKRYELEMDGRSVKLFKAVHKRGGRYWSDHDIDFEYVIGEAAVADGLDTSRTTSCGAGIHTAHKEWCVTFGKGWPDLAILEVEMELDSIIVPVNGEGKVRAKEAKVLREVPLEECGLLGQMLAKRRKEA